MKIRFTYRSILAFLAILFVCHELHEISHTAVGRAQCGCWGERDFNVWSLCDGCTDSISLLRASIAGPLLTYGLIWTGFFLMSSKNSIGIQSLGWVLVFANKPFARLFTVLMKSGDESLITRSLFHQQHLSATAWIINIAVVLLLITPPLARAWRLLDIPKQIWVFATFLLLPLLIELILLHKLGNHLLEKGILTQPGLLGSPVLINLWSATWLVVLLFYWKHLFCWLRVPAEETFITH